MQLAFFPKNKFPLRLEKSCAMMIHKQFCQMTFRFESLGKIFQKILICENQLFFLENVNVLDNFYIVINFHMVQSCFNKSIFSAIFHDYHKLIT